jgi:hypothetical protein
MGSSSRPKCVLCREKGVVILPDGTLVCYQHYNEHVAEMVTTGQPVKARLRRG